MYIYIETYIPKAKIFPPHHHTCNRTPGTWRLVPSPARGFGPDTTLHAVGEGIIILTCI